MARENVLRRCLNENVRRILSFIFQNWLGHFVDAGILLLCRIV